MIERIHKIPGAYDVSCLCCGGVERFEDCEGFGDVVETIKRNGWHIGNERGTWVHTCPDCRAEGRAKAMRRSG